MLFYGRIYLLNKNLLSSYYMLNPVLSAGVMAVNKTEEILILMSVCILRKGAIV